MQVFSYPLGALQTNCYLLVKNDHCLIIDPGDSAEFILEQILRKNVKPLAILATHGHYDHLLAVGEIQLSFPIPFYLHEKDKFLLSRARSLAPAKNIKSLTSGEMSIGEFRFSVLHTPGHTPGCCTFYFPNDHIAFTGDTVFKESIGEYTHSYSDKAQLKKSVIEILALPEEIILYPGHGDEVLVQERRDHS
jgi:hydroxyacylglutathione hydrolase